MPKEKQPLTALPFCRKACTVVEVQHRGAQNPLQEFQVERIILLTPDAYQDFSQNLMEDHFILFENTDKMWYEPDTRCWHCVLVTSPDVPDGILVESEGFAYARYTAFVPDKSRLALENVPIKDERPKPHRSRARGVEPR